MKIVYILTCFNRKEKTIRCIKSLPSLEDSRLVVVDDCSTDGTIEELRKIDMDIDIIEGTGNLYWNRGMYKGIEFAKKKYDEAEIYALINDDVVFYPNIFSEMIQKVNSGEVVVGSTCNDNGELSYGGIKYYKKTKYQMVGPHNNKILCDTFNANCVLIPRDILNMVGNLDPYYTHSMGDFDLGFQISGRNFPIRVFEEFVGICNDNVIENTWRDKNIPIRKRIELKENPKGLPRKEWFHYLYKNFGLSVAVIKSITPYVRIFLRK